LGTIDTYTWTFGEGAQPETATGAGPHTVTYTTEGDKEMLLTVSNSSGSDTKTISYMVHNCTAGIELPGEISKKMTVYPNPSTGVFHLSEELDWSIFSTLGVKIKSGSGNVIDITDHASGVYFVKTNKNTKAIHIVRQ